MNKISRLSAPLQPTTILSHCLLLLAQTALLSTWIILVLRRRAHPATAAAAVIATVLLQELTVSCMSWPSANWEPALPLATWRTLWSAWCLLQRKPSVQSGKLCCYIHINCILFYHFEALIDLTCFQLRYFNMLLSLMCKLFYMFCVFSIRKPEQDEELSAEASRVISGLPNLSFMRAKVLMFPAVLVPEEWCSSKLQWFVTFALIKTETKFKHYLWTHNSCSPCFVQNNLPAGHCQPRETSCRQFMYLFSYAEFYSAVLMMSLCVLYKHYLVEELLQLAWKQSYSQPITSWVWLFICFFKPHLIIGFSNAGNG